MSKKVLISGGAGYIGSHTVHVLRQKGYDVVVIDSLEKGHPQAIPENVPCLEGRVGDEKWVEAVIREHGPFEGVIHFAGYIEVGESVTHPSKYFSNNLMEALVFLNVCSRNGVKKFIFSSTAAVYGIPSEIPIKETTNANPINPYGCSKLGFEFVLKSYAIAYNIACVSLRYFNASGAAFGIGEDHDPETHLIPRVLKTALGLQPTIKIFGNDYNTADGTCIRDYVHVVDLAEAHILALEKSVVGKFEIFNLGNGTGYSVKEIVEKAQEVTGKKIPTVLAPRRLGDPDKLIADPNKAKETLGWQPTRLLDDIISSAWEWHSTNPNGFKTIK